MPLLMKPGLSFMQKKISLIVDTNWWISLILSKYKSPFIDLLLQEDILIFRSQELTEEIAHTLTNPKFKKIITEEVFDYFFQKYEACTLMQISKSVVDICRDPKDNFLLALAKDTKANFLITGDKDLLVLDKFEETIICTLKDFFQNHLLNFKNL